VEQGHRLGREALVEARLDDEVISYNTEADGSGEEIAMTREQDRQVLLELAQRRQWDDAETLREIAMACFHSGYFPEAAAICRRILELDPEDDGALLHLGVALLHDEQLGEAETTVLDYLRRCPECAVGHVNLAKVYGEMGRETDAVGALDRALDLDPDNTHALDLLYLTLREAGRTQAALDRLEHVAQDQPQSWGPYRTIAQHWQREDVVEQAVGYYLRAFERAPRSAELLRTLSGYLGQQGRIEELVSVVEWAAQLGPISPEATYNLARAYLELGRVEPARALLEALRGGATPAWKPVLDDLAAAIEEASLQPA